jgi:hypothetical protein
MTFEVGGKQYVAIQSGLNRNAMDINSMTPELREMRNQILAVCVRAITRLAVLRESGMAPSESDGPGIPFDDVIPQRFGKTGLLSLIACWASFRRSFARRAKSRSPLVFANRRIALAIASAPPQARGASRRSALL